VAASAPPSPPADVTLTSSDTPDCGHQVRHAALEGSVITGGIQLYVENSSLTTVNQLTGATIVRSSEAELRITDDQFTAIGANNFSVVRDEEGATEDLYIVVDSGTSPT
jgi:hypothetical protein